MDTSAAKSLALNVMQQYGLIEQGWTFRLDEAKKRFGVCRFRAKVIGLSRPLTEINSEAKVENTIRHEIAHALAGHKAGHGSQWKSMAVRVGSRPERCYKSDEVNSVPGKHRYICPSCSHIAHFYKALKRDKSCGRCCKTYNPAFKLRKLEPWENPDESRTKMPAQSDGTLFIQGLPPMRVYDVEIKWR